MSSFTFDMPLDAGEPPVAGDRLRTARVYYAIDEVRPVESRVWPNRDEPPPQGARCHRAARYQRGETPADYFGEPA